MTGMVKVGLVQMTSGPDIEGNLTVIGDMARDAAAQGCTFVLSPENSCHMRWPQADKLKSSRPEESHPGVPFFAGLAAENEIWLLAGSLSIKVAPDRIANRSMLFSPRGDIVARYDKIHLFDVDLPTGESHRESALVVAGNKAVVAQTPWGGVGLSICYDLRFAYLYRALAQAGAKILTVPAAFTVPTGQAHWHTLLRARAIETGSFVLAPAQCGEHHGGRRTYGHSLIIGPWGEIVAEAGEAPELLVAELDLGASDKAREAIPALRHDRTFSVVSG